MISTDTKYLFFALVRSLADDINYAYQRRNRGCRFGSCTRNLAIAFKLHFLDDSRNDVFWIVLDKGGSFSYRWEADPEF
jgi:hypothetical protein